MSQIPQIFGEAASLEICGICREEDRSLTLLRSDGLWRSLSERDRSLEVVIDVQVDVPDASDEAFTYDNVGNRTTDGGGSEWTYNTNNELLAAFPTLGNQNAIEYEYDANGNTIAMRAPESLGGHVLYSYVYNAADWLVKVCGLDVDAATCQSTTDPLAEYAYDPFGRRLWKDVGGTKTYFFYADEGLVAEYDDTGTETTAYGYRPNSTWTTDPLFLKQDGVYAFYQNDHLGTPQKLVGVNGAVVWSAQYTAFGKAEVQVEAVVNNLRFPGQYYDGETGLHYNWFRYYESRSGRYFKVDPIGMTGGTNLYLYVLSNPLILTDPTGENVRACERRFVGKAGYIIPFQHCYLDFMEEGAYGVNTLSFDNTGVRQDPMPNTQWRWMCYSVETDVDCPCENSEYDSDKWWTGAQTIIGKCCTKDCLKQAYSRCPTLKDPWFPNFMSGWRPWWNCCDCLRYALKECRCEVPKEFEKGFDFEAINWGLL